MSTNRKICLFKQIEVYLYFRILLSYKKKQTIDTNINMGECQNYEGLYGSIYESRRHLLISREMLLEGDVGSQQRGQRKFRKGWVCSLSWSWWWLHGCRHSSKLLKPYTFNICRLMYIDFTAIKLFLNSRITLETLNETDTTGQAPFPQPT